MSATVKSELDAYHEHLLFDGGLSAVTADGYRRCLAIVLRRAGAHCIGFDDIKRHILWMRAEGYSYSHVVNTSLALEHYARWRGMQLRIGRPRKPKRIVTGVLSEAEVIRLIGAAKSVRERALVCLLAYSGLRNSEICRLRVCDVDFGVNVIRVLGGKGKKDRVVSISAECTRLVLSYLVSFPRDEAAFLFTTLVKGEPLATGDVRKWVRVLANRAGIARRVFPHLLRHSLATNLLNRGAGLMLIKEQLGHAFIETTMVYLQSMPGRMRAEYDFYKPSYL